VDAAALPFTRGSADASLAEAASAVGVATDSAELIRLGSAAVYWLCGREIVARVFRSVDQLGIAEREIAVSRWLDRSHVPAVRALDLNQPVIAAGRVVTFWESVSDREGYGTTADLAHLLHVLHELSEPTEIQLSRLRPLDRVMSRLERAEGVDPADRSFLLDRCLTLSEAYDRLRFALPGGVIHGDASVGNVLRTKAGDAVLADLDGFAIGPREWDLLQTAMYYDRYSWHTEVEYRSFVDVYGFDIMEWDGYETLADVRELSMVAWLSQNVGADGGAKLEFTKRVKALRTGGSRRDWLPL
jgi:hypothetical protein